jgi:dTDP-4-dehydrorhamnose 3,5-epimerase
MLDGILITPLKVIHHPKGNIYHALKASSPGYQGFGEAYFSTITKGNIKGWKRHNNTYINLVVPFGSIEFILYDDRAHSSSFGKFYLIKLGININYQRLTIPPGIWVAFRGLSEINLLINFQAEEHDPNEADNLLIEDIPYPF